MAAAGAAALAAMLWRMALEPVDFGYIRYLGIADEMARSGDWVVTRIVDRVYLDKPPLFFWLMAAPIALLGEAPGWVAHLPDLLALALSLFCVQRLGAAIYGRGEPALVGMLVFATTWETFNQASGKRLDLVFAAFLTAAFTAFYLGAAGGKEGRPQPILLALAWLAVALATLTKGPLAILLFVLVALTWAAWSGRLRIFASRGSLVGIAICVGLAALWPALLIGRLGFEETLRALHGTDLATRKGGLLLYTQNLPVLQLPWSLFFPALAAWLWRRRPWAASNGFRFLLVWFIVIFVSLHFSEARHQRYLQPATPALSLLLLCLWYEPGGGLAPLKGAAERLARWASAGCLALLALGGSLAGVGLLLLDREPFFGHEIPPERWIAGPVALATGAFAAFTLRRLRRTGVALQSPLPLAVLLLGVLTSISLLAAGELRAKDPTKLARAALLPVTEGRPAALLGLDEEQHQMSRLLTRRPLLLLSSLEAAAQWARSQPEPGALVLTNDAGRRALAREPGLRIRILRDFELAQERVELLEIRSGT